LGENRIFLYGQIRGRPCKNDNNSGEQAHTILNDTYFESRDIQLSENVEHVSWHYYGASLQTIFVHGG